MSTATTCASELLENEKTGSVPVFVDVGHVPEMNRPRPALPNVVQKIESRFCRDAILSIFVFNETLEADARLLKGITRSIAAIFGRAGRGSDLQFRIRDRRECLPRNQQHLGVVDDDNSFSRLAVEL